MKGFGDIYKSEKKKNKKNKFSNKQIINQAIQLHLKGNIKEAKKHYEQIIKQGCNDDKVFSNYGAILQGMGKLKDADTSYRKAIELNPDYAIAHSNLGGVLRDIGNLKEAEIYTRKAIELNPEIENAHSNLGVILHDLDNLNEAEISLRKAIKLNPKYSVAYTNLGDLLINLGKSKEAFDLYLKGIEIDPTLSNVYPKISKFLEDADLTKLNKSKLKDILNLLLERNDVSHKELFNAFKFLYRDELITNLEKLDSDFSGLNLIINNKVIINALRKIIFCDFKLEATLTKTRKNLCDRIAKNIDNINYSELKFIIALGEQCFLNEYVYALTESEKSSLNIIIRKCINGELNEKNISILSCYFPLDKLIDQIPTLNTFSSSNQFFSELIKLQILEPLKEIKLSQNLKKIGSINDDVSQKVKSQYEENPYPRWRDGSHKGIEKFSINKAINVDIKPNFINEKDGEHNLKVLIAGCGTGQHILQAQRYKNAQITGIDLSLSSLSYAQRKINELGIDNVELIQMDILDLELLKEQYDIIESSGVLHHMNDPSQGLKKLLGSLKDNGFLKLGLYSELARQNIIKAREYITTKYHHPNNEAIRNFREDVFSGKIERLSNLSNFSDFYTMSECRDLCFHYQEHRFTIKQLEEILESYSCKFLGFLLSKAVKSLYGKDYPEDKTQTNLKNWARFEARYPNTFKGMYQFWVSKF